MFLHDGKLSLSAFAFFKTLSTAPEQPPQVIYVGRVGEMVFTKRRESRYLHVKLVLVNFRL